MKLKEKTDPQALVRDLMAAKEAYYAGAPVFCDAAFDALEDELRALDPGNAYFHRVGAAAAGNSGAKIRHQVPMLSADKAKTVSEAWDWLEKLGLTGHKVLIEPKLDGLSATLRYKGGHLAYIATRGDGATGQDISHIAGFVGGIPQRVPHLGDFEVRGELHIPKRSGVPNPEGSPLRHMAVGFINRKGDKNTLEDLRWIRFAAYQLVGTDEVLEANTETNVLKLLDYMGFRIPQVHQFNNLQELHGVYDAYLGSLREDWPFETDGLVLVVDDRNLHAVIDSRYEVRHHHHYNLALKPPSVGKETVLLGIDWNVSRLGRIVPVALVNPVVVGGVTITCCTLNNFKTVNDLRLHPGDRVLIERANDVIPFFAKNLDGEAHPERMSADPALLPAVCPSCGAPAYDATPHRVCRNRDCAEQQLQRLVHWVGACGMESFSEASVRALFEAGKIRKVADLYRLTSADFAGVRGFGAAKTKNALEQIEASRAMNVRQFVDRLSIELVGERAMEKLAISTPEALLAFNDETYVVGQNLAHFIQHNRQFVEELMNTLTIVPVTGPNAGTAGRLVCMTGTGPKKRHDLEDQIQAKGDHPIDRITKDVAILVCEDVTGNSSKLQKARKLGIQLLSYTEYFG